MELLMIALLLLMIIGSVIAIETRDLLSSVICVGAVGYIVSIAFLFLGAPDIAITQVVVEILVLVILIRATVSRDLTSPSGDREFFGAMIAVALLLLVGVFVIKTLDVALPEFGEPIFATATNAPGMHYITEGLATTGSANQVMSVIHDYRGFDTLLETTVLFTAILGTLTILRRQARKKVGEVERGGVMGEEEISDSVSAGMTSIVKNVSHWVCGFIFLFGVYIVLFGHLSPGGGFAGGVIIVCTFILFTLAFGRKEIAGLFPRKLAHNFYSLGALSYLVVGLLGLIVVADNPAFLKNFLPHGTPFRLFSAGLIPITNIIIGFTVTSAIFLVFISLSVLRVVDRKEGERKIVKRK